MEATQVSRLMKDKQSVARPHSRVLFSESTKEVLSRANCGWTLRTRRSVREADTEGHTGCDSTDEKRAEQAGPQTQRVGSWLSGTGEW